jgi:hypothetical protein
LILQYTNEIANSPVFPTYFGKYYATELVEALIEADYLVVRLIWSVSTHPVIYIKGICEDSEGDMCFFEAIWEECIENVPHPGKPNFVLEEVEIYD